MSSQEFSDDNRRGIILDSISHMRESGGRILVDETLTSWQPFQGHLESCIRDLITKVDNIFNELHKPESLGFEHFSLVEHAYYCGFMSPQKTLGFVKGGGFIHMERNIPHGLEWGLWDIQKKYLKTPNPLELYLMVCAYKEGPETKRMLEEFKDNFPFIE